MNILERDFFTDPEVLQDPTPYYAALRERGPVWREPHRGVFVLSGIAEILEVYADHERFSAIVGPLGPLVPIPPREPGESLAAMIERWLTIPSYRDELEAAGLGHDAEQIRAATGAQIARMQPLAESVFNSFLDLVGRPNRRAILPTRDTPE